MLRTPVNTQGRVRPSQSIGVPVGRREGTFQERRPRGGESSSMDQKLGVGVGAGVWKGRAAQTNGEGLI